MKIKHFLPLLLLLGSNEMLTAQEIALTPQPAHLTVKDGRYLRFGLTPACHFYLLQSKLGFKMLQS
jgi:hypothetical protein